PMVIAGIPFDIAMFALVDSVISFGVAPNNAAAALARCTIGSVARVFPEGLKPMGVNVRVKICPFFICLLYSFNPFVIEDLKIESIFFKYSLLSERISTSAHDSNGIALTDVPPPVLPTLKLVLPTAFVNAAASSLK